MTTVLLIRHAHTEAIGEFLAGRLVVIPAVRPEQQRVLADLAEALRRDARRPCDDFFEEPFFAQTVVRELVVV